MKVANTKQSARAVYIEQALQMKKNTQKFKRQTKLGKSSDKSQKIITVSVPSTTSDVNSNIASVNKKPKFKSKALKTSLVPNRKSLEEKIRYFKQSSEKKKKNSPQKVNVDNLKEQLNDIVHLTNGTVSFTNKKEILKKKKNISKKVNVDNLNEQLNGVVPLTNGTVSFTNEMDILKEKKNTPQKVNVDNLEKQLNGCPPLTNGTASFTNEINILKEKINTPKKANVNNLEEQLNRCPLTNGTASFTNEINILKEKKNTPQKVNVDNLEKQFIGCPPLTNDTASFTNEMNILKKKINTPKKPNVKNLEGQLKGCPSLTNGTASFTNEMNILKKKINTPKKANVKNLEGQLNGCPLAIGTASFTNETEVMKMATKKEKGGKKRKQDSEGKVLEKKLKKKKKANSKKKIMTIAAVKEAIHAETSKKVSEEDAVIIEPLSGAEIGAVNVDDSCEEGLKAFQWVIGPCSEEKFFRDYWEKKPLHIKRNDAQYYKGLFSTDVFDNILRENMVLYTKNLDITSYSNGKRETHNPIGQAHPPVVWDYYNNGCSVRMLNPQTFHRPVWRLLSVLQEYFKSFCGANIYLTPPDTQGFAPHWDDIEAFILQLEGKKHWRLYKPRSENEELPVNSSPNLSRDEIGEPILDIVLEEGDLLYFPRGYIHQGNAVENTHSLHITLSTYQKNTWGHLLEKLLPQALGLAMAEDVEFRRGLPRDYLDCMGIVNMDKDSPSRRAFTKKLGELVTRLMDMAPVDAAVDQRGASLMHDALPPLLTQDETVCSVYGGGERWCKKTKQVKNRVEIEPDTPIRLIRRNCLRVVAEEECVNVYHCLENTREYHQEDPQFIELVPENAPAIEALIHAYPKYITIESLPLNDETEKMAVATGLWERGLIVTAKPLDSPYDD